MIVKLNCRCEDVVILVDILSKDCGKLKNIMEAYEEEFGKTEISINDYLEQNGFEKYYLVEELYTIEF